MDEGPFRMPQRSADRSADNDPPTLSRPTEQPKQSHTESKSVHRSSTNYTPKEEKSTKRLIIVVSSIVVIALVAILGWSIVTNLSKPASAIDSGKYQAVFFTNGQVYFGKLREYNTEYMKLTDVYYLQTQATEEQTDPKNPQKTTSDKNSTTLIKLGDEIHGPEDEMIVSKDQVLFYENLKKDGKVSQSIEKYKNPN